MCRKPGENIWWWFKLRKKSDYGGALKKVRCENFVTRDEFMCKVYGAKSIHIVQCRIQSNVRFLG